MDDALHGCAVRPVGRLRRQRRVRRLRRLLAAVQAAVVVRQEVWERGYKTFFRPQPVANYDISLSGKFRAFGVFGFSQY